MGTEELVTKSKKVIIAERELNIKPSNDNNNDEKEKTHPILIIGSNNIFGKNVFLLNAGTEQQDIDFLMQHFSPELLDKFMFGLNTEIDKKSNEIN
ncbi:hypothetical protein GM3708_1538 [Geminocystis sp. NIES-3708]|nr:hypothetical protein GM3708_1538 [Geminocystis sp. NIES-3708]